MVSEIKTDDTFPECFLRVFFLEGFSKPFRLDLTAKGGEILPYIREDIPCRYIKQITLNFRSKKWLLGCSYGTKYSRLG